MAYFIVEIDSDYCTSQEAEDLLKQLTPVKSYKEITESKYTEALKA